MNREHKTIFIVNLFLFIIALNMIYPRAITSTGNTITTSDWENYHPISETNDTICNVKMMVDSNDNLHLFWCATNDFENYSRIVYEKQFTNGSIIRSVVVSENTNSTVFDYDVDIDNNNEIHLIYNNNNNESVIYQTLMNNSWEIIDEFQSNMQDFLVIADNSDIVHLIIVKMEGNFYDKIYQDGSFTNEIQITNYNFEEGEQYISIFNVRKAKSKQNKIALLYRYSLNSLLPDGEEAEETHCLIYTDHWLNHYVIAEYITPFYDLAYDDIEKLHVIWNSYTKSNAINYQTMIRTKWSEVREVILFDIVSDKQYGLIDASLEIQGKTRLIGYISSKMLTSSFDYDYYLTYTNNGEDWTNEPIYTNDDSRSYAPLIESTTDGDVYVTAYENFWQAEQNTTHYLGYEEGVFIYQTTTEAAGGNVVFLVPLSFSIITVIIFARRKKS
ncbi:MAG: hypothetical protein U9O98_03885 [Asgard group archaeon]|nr:hypothetical protein [Asgard group archaeon]